MRQCPRKHRIASCDYYLGLHKGIGAGTSGRLCARRCSGEHDERGAREHRPTVEGQGGSSQQAQYSGNAHEDSVPPHHPHGPSEVQCLLAHLPSPVLTVWCPDAHHHRACCDAPTLGDLPMPRRLRRSWHSCWTPEDSGYGPGIGAGTASGAPRRMPKSCETSPGSTRPTINSAHRGNAE